MSGQANKIRDAPPVTSWESLPVLMKPAEVASLLRTTTKAIYLRIERGSLPGVVRLGNRILVERDAVLSWLRESRSPSSEFPR